MYTVARTLPQPTIAVAEANARRIVACWNMLDGEPTEHIEADPLPAMLDKLQDHLKSLTTNIATIATQRDVLLAAAQATLAKNLHLADGDTCTLIDLKRAVEKITGEPV